MSRSSTVRPVSAAGAAQATLLFMGFVVAAAVVGGTWLHGLLLGSMGFLLYRFGFVRLVLCRHQRDGVALTRAGRYDEALKAFARSAEAWESRRRLDDLRGLLLGSASRWPFRHLSRYNEAWCLARLGHDAEARVVLDALLRDQPRLFMAKELLASLDPAAAPPGAQADPEAGWGDLLHDEPTIDRADVPDA